MCGRILAAIFAAILIGDGPRAEPAREDPSSLIAKLGAGQFTDREAAAKALEALGDRAVPALKGAGGHRDPEVRDRSTRVLERIEEGAYWRRHREVLGWLPTDIQAIVAARGPWRVVPPHDHKGYQGRRLEDLLRASAFGDLYDLAESEDEYVRRDGRRVPFRALVDRPTDLTLAARRIEGNKAGEPIGGSCHVIHFRDHLGTLGDDWFEALEAVAVTAATIEGVRVVAFDKSISPGDAVGSIGGRIYLARPAPDLVVTTTDRAMMADVLSRRAGHAKPGGRALPDSLPEWGSFDPEARCWAIRHYNRASAPLDLTSPIGGKDGELLRHFESEFVGAKADNIARFFMFQDRAAIGLAVTLKDGEATLRYFSPNPETLGAMTSYWSWLPGQHTTSRQAEPGVVAVTLPASENDTDQEIGYYVFLDWFLGRGMYGWGLPPALFLNFSI